MGFRDSIRDATSWLNVPRKKDMRDVATMDDEIRQALVSPHAQDRYSIIDTSPVVVPERQTPVNTSPIRSTITTKDNLRLRSWASIAIKLRVTIRCLMSNGEIKTVIATQNTGITRVKNAVIVSLPHGVIEILSAAVSTLNSGCVRGRCFVSLALVTSGPQLEEAGTHNVDIKHGESVVVRTLLQGYLVSGCTLQLGTFEDSLSGRGVPISQVVAFNIAGITTLIVPNGAVWRLHSLTGQISTSAAVPARFPQINIIASLGKIYEATQLVGTAANTVQTFVFAGNAYSPSTEEPMTMPLPPELLLPEVTAITLDVIQNQAGDIATQDLTYTYEEWIVTDES